MMRTSHHVHKIRRSKYIGMFLLILLTCLAAACESAEPVTLSFKVLAYPNADYESLMSVNQQVTAFVRNQNPIAAPEQFGRQADSFLHEIQLPQDKRCIEPTTLYLADPLPDGRLQLWENCHVANQHGAVITLRAFDFMTGETEPIDGMLPLGSKDSTWDRDGSQGLAYLDDGYASRTFYSITKDGFQPLNLIVGEGGKSWNLQDDFPSFNAAERGLSGDVGRAAWSPNGKTIAFFASPEAIGKTGADRFYVEYNLYLMDAQKLQPHAVQPGIYFLFFIKWSPDSKHVAFIAQYGSARQDGVWIYSLADNKIHVVATGIFQDILWSPDGKSLTAIQCNHQYYCSKILEFDVSSIVWP